jgi:hypothetical protein
MKIFFSDIREHSKIFSIVLQCIPKLWSNDNTKNVQDYFMQLMGYTYIAKNHE